MNRHHTDKLKISIVLFDEIEKASDSLWNLLLGILDKGILTLGDNRNVDFSSSMIFLTSNLGASGNVRLELSAGWAFTRPQPEDADFSDELEPADVACRRRRGPPEVYA